MENHIPVRPDRLLNGLYGMKLALDLSYVIDATKGMNRGANLCLAI